MQLVYLMLTSWSICVQYEGQHECSGVNEDCSLRSQALEWMELLERFWRGAVFLEDVSRSSVRIEAEDIIGDNK